LAENSLFIILIMTKSASVDAVRARSPDGFCRMTSPERVQAYLLSLPLSFLVFASAWAMIAPNYLYHCWDDVPLFGVSWHPPFIHPWANSADGQLFDYYRVPEPLVYGVWLLFIAGVFVAPAWVARSVTEDCETAPQDGAVH
jgi:hypothetical protein